MGLAATLISSEQNPAERFQRRRMSLGQWVMLPEDEPGELVDGWLVEEELASALHELCAGWLTRVLGNWVDPRGGFVFGSELKFAVGLAAGEERGRKPDLTVFFAGTALPPATGAALSPPDIAVEIISPSPRDVRRDRVEKMDDYAAFGVRWYWVMDPQARSLEIFERGQDGRYTWARAGLDGTLEHVPGCPGLALPLGELWGKLDRLEPPASPPPSG